MKQSRIKGFFIKEGLKTSNPNSWKDFVVCDENILKETEKAVYVKHTLTKECVWIPKGCLKAITDEEDFKPVPFPSANAIPNPVDTAPYACAYGDTSANVAKLPDEVKSIFDKCQGCGCINDNKCTMYNLATHFALLLCMQNDLEAKDTDLEVSNYRIAELEQKVINLGGEI